MINVFFQGNKEKQIVEKSHVIITPYEQKNRIHLQFQVDLMTMCIR